MYKSTNKLYKSIKVHKQPAFQKRATLTENNLGEVMKSPKAAGKKDKEESEKETIYRFYSFQDRDFTFKYIRRLWSNASPHAESDEDSSQESEEEKAKEQISTPNK